MTKKGERIKEELLSYLERNPDGMRVSDLQNLIDVSRNSIYRYLGELEKDELVEKDENKLWSLTEPIKPKTIPGYHYQAILKGLKELSEKGEWDINTKNGQENFKKLGRFIFPYLKVPEIDIESLKDQNHHMDDIMEYATKLMQEAATVEDSYFESKMDSNGFPNPDSRLAAMISFKGGYIASDPVDGNGFGHYYILAGLVEAFAEKVIKPIYGGRCICNVLKIEERRQIVDLGVFMIFDKQDPYIDPATLIRYDFESRYPPDF